mgnify:FL=1
MKNHDLNRRGVLAGISTVAGMATTGSLLSVRPAQAAGKYKIQMQLGWLASNGILGEVMADKLGYFAEEGLELEIIPGGPNIDGVSSVASGANNFASISSSPSLMLARSAGLPIKCVAAGYQQHPFTYFSLTGNPIRKPSDLIGKRIGTQGTAQILMRAMLAQNGISEDDVEIVVMGGDMSALMTGQVDAVSGWKTNVGALSVLGDERVDLMLWDAGIQLYANPYYTTDSVLEKDGDKITAAISAIARGWGAAHANPEAAVNALVERYPNLDRDSEMKAVDLVLGFSFNEKTGANGWGQMTIENWQKQIDIYEKLGQFANGAPAVEDVMTLDVLNATATVRPTIG